MKKLLLSLVAALTVAGAASAQNVVNNPNNRAYFGIRASYDLTCPGSWKAHDHDMDLFKNGSGLSVGLIYNQPIVANLYVEPGLNLYYNTTGLKLDGGFDELGDIIDVKHASLRSFGMRVPVMFGYHFDFLPNLNMSVFTGPELQVGFSNDSYITMDLNGRKAFHEATSEYGDDGSMNRVDCKWKFGVGFNINTNYYVGLEGAVGMVDLAKHENVTYHENRFSVTLGYNF